MPRNQRRCSERSVLRGSSYLLSTVANKLLDLFRQGVLRQTIKSGAWGFISKSDEPPVLLDTISWVARGRLCFPYVDLETLSQDPLEMLTSRERELLAALANGWSNLQIASRIGISRNTVKYHLKNLYDKLGVNNRAMAVALYMSKTSRTSLQDSLG